MSEVDVVEVACGAKVNLTLSVGSAEEGAGGMHPIASWMVAVGFSDRLRLRRLEEGGASSLRIEVPRGARPGVVVDWPIEKDLAWRAHRLLEAEVGRGLATEMVLEKRIPAQAGLGGGSSDAGGALVGLNRLHGLGLRDEALVGLGGRLGSDVGFLVWAALGEGSAVAGGYGEELEMLRGGRVMHLVLIFPGFGCPTGEVYRAFDSINEGRVKGVEMERVRRLAEGGVVERGELFNDLAKAACRVRPELGEIRARAGAVLGTEVHVTGSGSTLFVVAGSGEQGREWAGRLDRELGLVAVATETV